MWSTLGRILLLLLFLLLLLLFLLLLLHSVGRGQEGKGREYKRREGAVSEGIATPSLNKKGASWSNIHLGHNLKNIDLANGCLPRKERPQKHELQLRGDLGHWKHV